MASKQESREVNINDNNIADHTLPSEIMCSQDNMSTASSITQSSNSKKKSKAHRSIFRTGDSSAPPISLHSTGGNQRQPHRYIYCYRSATVLATATAEKSYTQCSLLA